jgi:pyruvate dehydrogenase E1 component alpha subunit/2-oxoisovalerate dehydrogenase E1 component
MAWKAIIKSDRDWVEAPNLQSYEQHMNRSPGNRRGWSWMDCLREAASTLQRHQAQRDITLKAQAEGVTAEAVDGMDVVAVETAMKRATGFVREKCEPYLIEFRTYRFRAHSMYDAELYRSKEEVEEWKKHCPIANFIERLRKSESLTDAEIDAIESSIAIEIDKAIAFAEADEWEPVEDLMKDVYTTSR